MKKNIQRQNLSVAKTIFEKIEYYFTGDVDVELADLILRNVDSIDAELGLIDKNPALKVPDDFAQYDERRVALVKEFSEIGADGEIVVVPGTQDAQMSDENAGKFAIAVDALKAEYSTLMDEVAAINIKRDEFMSAEVEIDVYPIAKNLLNKIKSEGKPNGFAIAVMSAVRPFLAE